MPRLLTEFLLDTNVVSELRKAKAGRADPHVASWAESVEPQSLYVSAITIQELEIGVLLTERRDPITGALFRNWLDNHVHRAFEQRILPVDGQVERRAAALHVPDPAPVEDALIAATALTHRMKMVTRDTRHFKRFAGLEILNPWKPV